MDFQKNAAYQCGHIWKCGQTPPWLLLQCVCVHVNFTTAPARVACTGACSFFFPPLHEQSRLSTHCTLQRKIRYHVQYRGLASWQRSEPSRTLPWVLRIGHCIGKSSVLGRGDDDFRRISAGAGDFGPVELAASDGFWSADDTLLACCATCDNMATQLSLESGSIIFRHQKYRWMCSAPADAMLCSASGRRQLPRCCFRVGTSVRV